MPKEKMSILASTKEKLCSSSMLLHNGMPAICHRISSLNPLSSSLRFAYCVPLFHLLTVDSPTPTILNSASSTRLTKKKVLVSCSLSNNRTCFDNLYIHQSYTDHWFYYCDQILRFWPFLAISLEGRSPETTNRLWNLLAHVSRLNTQSLIRLYMCTYIWRFNCVSHGFILSINLDFKLSSTACLIRLMWMETILLLCINSWNLAKVDS